MKNILYKSFLVAACMFTLIGCGTKVGTGAVNVEFSNNTTSTMRAEFKSLGVLEMLNEMALSNSLLGITPTIYQIKLVALYLTEGMDANGTNTGAGTHIWTSNKCDSDLTFCGIDPAHSGPYVVDYFDLAQGSAAVNAIFNSYKRDTKDSQLGAGTYNYIRMDFSGKVYDDNDTFPNLKFGTTTAHEVRAQESGFTVQLSQPLVLNEGESFTVNLAYDLDKRYYPSSTNYPIPTEANDAGFWSCVGTGSGIPCIVEVKFVPTVTKN